MPEQKWERLAGDGVGGSGRRDEDRPGEVLVQVGAADAAPVDLHLHAAGPHVRLGHVLEADVARTMEHGGFHDSLLLRSEPEGDATHAQVASRLHRGWRDREPARPSTRSRHGAIRPRPRCVPRRVVLGAAGGGAVGRRARRPDVRPPGQRRGRDARRRRDARRLRRADRGGPGRAARAGRARGAQHGRRAGHAGRGPMAGRASRGSSTSPRSCPATGRASSI